MEAEIQGYLTEFGILRGQIRDALKGLSDEGGNWHPLSAGANSIYALLTHILSADNFWVRQVIKGEQVHRDREADFRSSGSSTEAFDRWEKAWKDYAEILGSLSRAQLSETRILPFRPERQESITVQWIVLHLISHHATHLGHIQLTRQLWDQNKTKAAPK